MTTSSTDLISQKDTVLISVNTGDTPRINRVVEVRLELDLNQIAGLRLHECDAQQHVINQDVPFQLDRLEQPSYTLSFLMDGRTEPQQTRTYQLCLDAEAVATSHPQPLVSVHEVYHQGQDAFQIHTLAATLIFHKYGGGFASLVDANGDDWISYRPQGGSDGKYRGIPNIKHPDDYFHPGATNARSELVHTGAVKCQLRTQTLDGVCDAVWDIYPHYMTMTLQKTPDVYWLLYEGTPGGKLNEQDDFVTWSDGTRKPLGERWDKVLRSGWLYFSAAHSQRSLFFAQHNTEAKLSSYFPMEGNMTVFGFGRKDLEHYLTNCPAQYSFGLVDSYDHADVTTHVNSACHELQVDVQVSTPST
ncbi:MAG: hypothetical protein AAF267_05565 [Deinococcota bacterium]